MSRPADARRRPAALLGLAALACAPAPAPGPPSPWPAGTALVVGDVPIAAEEVEAAADAIAECNPAFTRRAAVRHALIGQLIPRAAVRAHHPQDSREALVRAEADLERLRAGEEPADAPVQHVSGTVRRLAFEPWRHARDLAPGEWHGPFEARGAWFCVRLVERTGVGDARDELEIDAVFRSYMPDGWTTDQATTCMAQVPLRLVDPNYARAVPLSGRARMAEVVEPGKSGT